MQRERDTAATYLQGRRESGEETFMEATRTPPPSDAAGTDLSRAASTIEPPSVPDGTFVKVGDGEHPLPRACEVAVYFQDYHRSSSKLGRFGKIVGIDIDD